MNKTLLILDDDLHLCNALASEFTDRGYEVYTARKVAEIPYHPFEFAIIDLRLVGHLGLDGITVLKEQSPDCKMVVLSGYGSITTAVEAIKRGAIDYLRKPTGVDEIELALLGLRNAAPTDVLNTPSLSEVESEYIDHVLTRNAGNISKTAKELGLHRQSLQRKLKKYS